MNGDAIGSQVGPIAGVGRMTTAELSASARGHVLYSRAEVVVFAAGAMLPHEPHEGAVVRLVGCSHNLHITYLAKYSTIPSSSL
jgi:hypothetical protein